MEDFIVKYAVYLSMVYMLIEFILGKTKLVKENSVIETVLNVVMKILDYINPKKEENKLL